MADWNNGVPQWLSVKWADIQTMFGALWSDCATMFQTTGATNIPNKAVKWNPDSKRFEIYDSSVPNFVELAAEYAINVARLKNMTPSVTAAATSIMQRDANGRSQVQAPAAASDIARKAEFDTVNTALANFQARRDNPHAVSKAQVGLGTVLDVVQFAVSRNLAEGDAPTMRANLGIGTAGLRDVGTADENVALYSQIVSLQNQINALKLPVGSLYMNDRNSTNPSSLLGYGSWSALGAGRVIVGAGGNYYAQNTGGSERVTLTISQIPSHTHINDSDFTYSGDSTNNIGYEGSSSNRLRWGDGQTGAAGGGASHENMMPYYVAYRWVRTA